MPARRIGILGGTFDPIHCGHIDLAHAAEAALGLTRIYVITAAVPPHRPQPAASAFHRFAMVAMAVAHRPGWRASDLELRSPSPSYTAITLRKFHERGYAPSELFFVLGADAFAEIGSWREYPDILDAAHFAVVSRPRHPVSELYDRLPLLGDRMVRPPVGALTQIDPAIILIDAPTPDVSSTAIRQRVAAGDSIAAMVPPAVQQHIEQHGLYTSIGSGRRASDAQRPSQAGRLHGQD
ncbi:MAG TPA: nicotinate-nucleotide adenylyltransferase [Rhodanobacteraceae bacterium]